LPRLLESAIESRRIQERLGANGFRIYNVTMGGAMTGSFTFSSELDDVEAALDFQERWDSDAGAQAFMAEYMMNQPPVTIESIDLLTELDVGTGASTKAPTSGLAVQVVPHRGATEAAVAVLADGSPFVRKLGALSVRLLAFDVGGEQAGGLVQWIETTSLREVGRIIDVFNDSGNAQAMKFRSAFDDRDGPIASFATFVVKELAY
jgi:hypothetical protein